MTDLCTGVQYLLLTALMYGIFRLPLEARAPKNAATSVALWKHSVDCW